LILSKYVRLVELSCNESDVLELARTWMLSLQY
jgi:hypothetical protein